jgi:hypothetical protein
VSVTGTLQHRKNLVIAQFQRSAIAVCLGLLGLQSPAAAEPMTVLLDKAQIVRLPERVATLVIGNPAVVDGTLQAGGLLVVTGKSYGTTNIIALDQRGNILAEHNVTVGAPREATITVWRGAKRETWSCAPRCENSVMLGDNPEYFDAVAGQIQNRNTHAAGGHAAGGDK